MNEQTKRLEKAKQTMLRIMGNRSDHRNYLSIVLHLERIIAASKSDDEELERIMKMAAAM